MQSPAAHAVDATRRCMPLPLLLVPGLTSTDMRSAARAQACKQHSRAANTTLDCTAHSAQRTGAERYAAVRHCPMRTARANCVATCHVRCRRTAHSLACTLLPTPPRATAAAATAAATAELRPAAAPLQPLNSQGQVRSSCTRMRARSSAPPQRPAPARAPPHTCRPHPPRRSQPPRAARLRPARRARPRAATPSPLALTTSEG